MKRMIARIIMLLPGIVMQIMWYLFVFTLFKSTKTYMDIILKSVALLLSIYVAMSKGKLNYKILWVILIMLFPFFGTWLYLTCGNKKTVKPLLKRIKKARSDIKFNEITGSLVVEELKDESLKYFNILNSVSEQSGFPIKYLEDVKYYSLGDDMYKDMLKELKKAEEFIYIEYFVIANGTFLDNFLDIIRKKIKEGVDVRILYDDIGSILTFNGSDIRKLKKYGIKCHAFNKNMFITGTINNRDHRKMLVIDNKVAFSGGINLADEYINTINRFGHWKDIGFKITGAPVSNYTYMFVEFWNAFSKDKINVRRIIPSRNIKKKGYILSYYDSPANDESVSSNLYVDMLGAATRYAYFYTPYLILDEDLESALERAALRGVDVRIIMPGIPDKKMIFRLSKSYYGNLIDAGVKIYEYKPGFIHAKMALIDDEICTVGTVNLDYRSLFLHFENNSIFFRSHIIRDVKNDFETTLRKSRRVAKPKYKFINKIIDSILRLIAPLC